MKIILFLLGISVASGFGTAYAENSRVTLQAITSGAVVTNQVTYQFNLKDNDTNSVVKDSDLVISNEKILHFIVYDPSLREFQHVHPEFDGQSWHVDLKFSVSGIYWLWAQGELLDGSDFSSPERLTVQLSSPAWPTPPQLSDQRSGSDGNSVVTMDNKKLRAGQMAMLMVEISRNDGTIAQPSPYLGAFAHVVSVFEDAASLIHVHAQDTGNPRQGMLHVTFPYAGKYRLWIQFIDGGILKNVPLSVDVQK